mmetsp:Transcript_89891/g.159939  ORF Transcript_89891/g.159939 Transcript_89891/m.159939 type:complete len:230 (-) Transcript_89891:82-771(-)
MVVPLGGGGFQQQEAPAPAVVKESYSYWWWALFAGYIATAGVEIMGGDAFGMLFTLIMAGIIYYMVSNSCANMSMYCILVFGLISSFEALFSLLTLMSELGGRSSTSTVVSSKEGSSTTYTTTVTTHAFFDGSLGVKYNMQSVAYLIMPIIMALGATLSWYTYKAYPVSLFGDFDDEEVGGRPGAGFSSGFRNQTRYGTQAQAGPSGPSQEERDRRTRLFEGSGQRLGS